MAVHGTSPAFGSLCAGPGPGAARLRRGSAPRGARHHYSPLRPAGETTQKGVANDSSEICLARGSLYGRARVERVCRRRRHDGRRGNRHFGNRRRRHDPPPVSRMSSACLSEELLYQNYTAGCSGHDEPELNPVLSASSFAQNIIWRVALLADAAFPGIAASGRRSGSAAPSTTRTRQKLGGEGFLELQFYPGLVHQAVHCPTGASTLKQGAERSTQRARPSGRSRSRDSSITEPAAFNGMLTDAGGQEPVREARSRRGRRAHLGAIA